MRGKAKLLVTVLAVTVFLFSTVGVAYAMEQKERSAASGATAFQENSDPASDPADAYQHKEKHNFEVKTRMRNKGSELRVRVEQRLEQEIAEEIGDEQFEDGQFENGQFGDGQFENGKLSEPGAKGLEKRIAELEKKLAEEPNDTKVALKLAVAYRNVGEYDKAIAVLKELQQQLPHPTAEVAVLLAQCLRAKGDREAALAELEKLLESPATVPGAVHAYRGILKEELGKVEEAAEDMEDAIAAEPKDEGLYEKLSELYSKAGKKGIKVFVKGKKLAFDAEPFVENGRTMVPVRTIAEALGLNVDYDGEKGVVRISNPTNGKTLVLYLGRAEAEVDGRKVTLDAPARVVPPGRTVVPLRFVSENMGADVKWFEDGQVVAVNEQ